MSIDSWNGIDEDHCRALTHEYFRCEDAFKLFCECAEYMILREKTREISYRAYNAYSSFIHHLYEFLLGAHARDRKNKNITNKKGEERTRIIEGYITFQAQRVMNRYRDDIKEGRAPSWVNDISYYDVTVPAEFATDFRLYRNKISGHVSHERVSELNLSEFYQKYHKYIYYIFLDSKYMWGGGDEEFPDLKEITEFSVMVTAPSQAVAGG